jgi:AcrR family transcriptional regulator
MIKKRSAVPAAKPVRAAGTIKTLAGKTAAKARLRKPRTPEPERHHREAPDVRRKSIIQATMRSIAKFGFAGTTIGNICAEAQVSRGLINHHFGTKEELLRQAYKGLCEEWEFQTRDLLLEANRDPEEKLRAMIRVNFGPTLFRQDHLAIWIGFWSVIGKSPALRKLNRELYKQDRNAYEKAFEDVARQRGRTVNARRAAIALSSLMDGLWLQWCLDPQGFSPEEAEAACLDLVNGSFR